jgi:hypothetical protein
MTESGPGVEPARRGVATRGGDVCCRVMGPSPTEGGLRPAAREGSVSVVENGGGRGAWEPPEGVACSTR